ncbi:hypothetical protein PhCBS80983_g05350 [Powellomyces hirtus]|uniref:Uncharacterized protein n=1 Tax=Powellomyces hirtus TaxID=109895 RepID=A0A507DWQ8_9FUNG|nr:hypothetical protein PhCBS80983_g05350 [Powellomyces hirtus]
MQRNGFAPPRHQGPCVDPALESEIQQFAASGVLGSPRDNVWEGLRSSEIPPLSQHRSSDLDIRNPAAYRQFMSAMGMAPGAPLRSVLISVGPAADGKLENVPLENYASLRRRQESEYAIRQVKDGIDAFQQNDYETAMRKYRTALEQDPNCVDAYVARGALYAKQDQFNKAIQDFKDALDVNPDHANAAAYLRMTENKLADIEREKQSAAMGEFLMPVDFDPRKSVLSMSSVKAAVPRVGFSTSAASSVTDFSATGSIGEDERLERVGGPLQPVHRLKRSLSSPPPPSSKKGQERGSSHTKDKKKKKKKEKKKKSSPRSSSRRRDSSYDSASSTSAPARAIDSGVDAFRRDRRGAGVAERLKKRMSFPRSPGWDRGSD